MAIKNSLRLLLVLIVLFSCSKKNIERTENTVSDGQVKIDTDTIEVAPEKPEVIVPKNNYAFDFEVSDNLSDVLKKAKTANKLVFLDVHAEWCAPCKLMQRDVYTHPETAAFFNEHFINYMVDVDTAEGPDLKLIYDISALPAMFWLDGNGRVIHKKVGGCYHEEIIRNAKVALENYKL